jgi:hypothetical protein
MNEEQQITVAPAVNFLPAVPFGITKAQGDNIAVEFVGRLLEQGFANEKEPLQMAEAFSGIEYIIGKIKENPAYIGLIRDEISKYGKDGYKSESGAVLECMETGTKYDYSNDAEWVELNKVFKTAEAARKAREEYLKKIPAGTQIVEDGVILAEAPSKTSKSTYKVSLYGERSKK